jgi:uncharacterized membrane protein SirB2
MRVGRIVVRLVLLGVVGLFYLAIGAKSDFKYWITGALIGIILSIPLGMFLTQRQRRKEKENNPEGWITIT